MYGGMGVPPGAAPLGPPKIKMPVPLSAEDEARFKEDWGLLEKAGKYNKDDMKRWSEWYKTKATPEQRAAEHKELSSGKGSPFLMTPIPAPKDDTKKPEVKPEPKKEGSQLFGPARIIVSLPADAILTVDGNATRSTSSLRTFQTPLLNPGGHLYEMQATVERDGVLIQVNRTVRFRAGETVEVNIEIPSSKQMAAQK